MKLNRSFIKSQARQLIKGKVWKLFLTMMVISLCMSVVSLICSGILDAYAALNGIRTNDFDGYSDFFDGFERGYNYGYNQGDDNENDFDSDYFNDFSGDGEGADFFGFGSKVAPVAYTAATPAAQHTYNVLSAILEPISTISTIALAPLSVALAIFFVWFIRGQEYEISKGLEIILKTAFSPDYFRKLLCSFLRGLLICLLGCLFIVPGIVFYYSSYFAFELLCDYPQLSAWEAIKLSKKMVRGHRGELFALDLSFIGWYLLCLFIFPAIYVMPYTATAHALYYENFRLRALQTGELSEDDFLSEQQRMAKYASGAGIGTNPFGIENQTAGSYVSQPQQGFAPQAGYYQPPVQTQPQQTFYQPAVSQQVQQPAVPQAPVAPSPAEQPAQTSAPEFTVTEPAEPTYAQVILPEEPVEAFTEPTKPTELAESFTEEASPVDPTDIN